MLYPECTTKYYYLFAFGSATDCYDTFGQVPITWKFRLSVSGQVANPTFQKKILPNRKALLSN